MLEVHLKTVIHTYNEEGLQTGTITLTQVNIHQRNHYCVEYYRGIFSTHRDKDCSPKVKKKNPLSFLIMFPLP